MTTEAQTAPETGPISLDQFASLMTAEQEKAAAPEEEEKPLKAPDPDNAAAEGGDEPDAEEEPIEAADEDEEEAEEVKEPIPDPPQSWSKEDREGWAELTPKAREVVLKREGDRDKAVAQAVQKASEAVKIVQTLAAKTEEISALATTEYDRKWLIKQGGVNWVKLAQLSREHPDQYDYASTRAAFEADTDALQKAQAESAKQSQVAQATFLADEAKKLETLEPELVDPEKGQARRQKTFDYLATEGFPRELFANISALELKIAYKAYRFDESQKAAAKAANLPRKNPTAPASKVVKPTGDGVGASSSYARQHQILSAKLTKSGKLDDFVALENLEEGERARKAQRAQR